MLIHVVSVFFSRFGSQASNDSFGNFVHNYIYIIENYWKWTFASFFSPPFSTVFLIGKIHLIKQRKRDDILVKHIIVRLIEFLNEWTQVIKGIQRHLN